MRERVKQLASEFAEHLRTCNVCQYIENLIDLRRAMLKHGSIVIEHRSEKRLKYELEKYILNGKLINRASFCWKPFSKGRDLQLSRKAIRLVFKLEV